MSQLPSSRFFGLNQIIDVNLAIQFYLENKFPPYGHVYGSRVHSGTDPWCGMKQYLIRAGNMIGIFNSITQSTHKEIVLFVTRPDSIREERD